MLFRSGGFHERIHVRQHTRIKTVVLGNKSLDGRDLDVPSAECAFALLPALTSLRRLVVHDNLADELFGFFGRTGRQASRLSDFQYFGSKFTCLELLYLGPYELAPTLIRACPNLVKLRIEDCEWSDYGYDTYVVFLDALSTLTKLSDLDLSPGDFAWWLSERNEWTAPPVKVLKTNFGYSCGLATLLQKFSGTIESLSLTDVRFYVDEEAGEALPTPATITLPHLSSLTMRADARKHYDNSYEPQFKPDDEQELFRHFEASPLVSFSYRNPLIELPLPPTSPLQQFLARQTNLRHVDLDTRGFETPDQPASTSASALAEFSTLVRSRGLDATVLEDDSRSPFAPGADHNYSENDLELPAASLLRTLHYGVNEVMRMVREGNVARLGRWVGVLGQLEGKRLEWAD